MPGSINDYRDEHPSAAVLVAEIADSSLPFDRTDKAAVYAGAGIPEYWIVNLVDHRLEVLREPAGRAYQRRFALEPADTITPLAAPDARVAVAAVFP